MTSVYLLVASDAYYPAHDNTVAVFEREAPAKQICEEINAASKWDAEDGDWRRIVERYPWLPEWKFDTYTVEEKELIER